MGGDYPAARVQSRVPLAYDTTASDVFRDSSRQFVASTCGFYKTLKKFQILACIGAMVPVYYPLRRGLSAVGSAPPCQGGGRGFEPRSPLHAFPGRCESAFFIWRSGQVVRHGPAKPLPPVRIRASPPEETGHPLRRVPFLVAAPARRPPPCSRSLSLFLKTASWQLGKLWESFRESDILREMSGARPLWRRFGAGRAVPAAGATEDAARLPRRCQKPQSSRVRAQASPGAQRFPSLRACA